MYEYPFALGRRSRFPRGVLLPLHPWASRHRISKAPWPRSPSTASPNRPSRSTSAPKLDTIGKFESAGGSRLFHNILLGIHSLSTAKNVFALVGYSPFDTVG